MTLDKTERNLVFIVAEARRNLASRASSYHWQNSFSTHMIGAGGELAFCKATHLPWRPTVGFDERRTLADVLPNYEIKTTTKPGYGVRVKIHGDMAARLALNYVLVRYLGERDFDVVGWIPGGMVPLLGLVKHFRSAGPPCYLVEAEDLKPIEELLDG